MKSKKIISVLTAITMGLSVAACASDDDVSEAPEVISGGNAAVESDSNSNVGGAEGPSSVQPSADAYAPVIHGVEIKCNAQADAIIEALGDNYELFESPSCAFQGTDRVYTYDDVIIRTYPIDDVDYVSAVEFRNDTISTAEGIYIGCSQDDVTAAYGDPTNELAAGIEYTKGDVTLSFVVRDGSVSAITYLAIVE